MIVLPGNCMGSGEQNPPLSWGISSLAGGNHSSYGDTTSNQAEQARGEGCLVSTELSEEVDCSRQSFSTHHLLVSRWIWVWTSSGSWWWTVKPGALQSMGSQRVRHNWATELSWTGGGILCVGLFVPGLSCISGFYPQMLISPPHCDDQRCLLLLFNH